MALAALLAQLAIMRILFMADITLGGCIPKFLAADMTAFTVQAGMGALEGKIRELVLEQVCIQLDDIRMPAGVFDVTAFAGLVPGGLVTSVKSAAGFYILVNLLVAVQAQAFLATPIHDGMTLVTVMFKFGMPLDNLAGHNELFDGVGVRLVRCQ